MSKNSRFFGFFLKNRSRQTGSIMTFLKKVCFLRRFSVVFLRCLGGDVVEIRNYLGSQGPFSGVFGHFLTPIWVKQHAGVAAIPLPYHFHTIFLM